MKTRITSMLLLAILITTSCSASKRAEHKKKKEQEKLEQLESDKKQFEQKNRGELGK
jgi:PBP1b-binding outer membrane lipoprotein LpoB